MFITYVGNDYVDFIYDNIERVSYPFKNNGFNMSFIKLDNNRELYIFRNVFPYKSIVNKKELVPGIPLKFSNNKFYNSENFSNNFIWLWYNYYESNIMFVGALQKDGHIIPDRNIKPMALIDPKYSYKVPEVLSKKLKPMHHYLRKEDFRLVRTKDKVLIMDSNINSLSEIIIKNGAIKEGKLKIMGLCEINFPKINNNKYKFIKIFEKNWSLYKSYFDNNGLNMLFFHDFDETGIVSVNYNKKKCTQKYIVKFNKDIIPNDDKSVIRFSFGSTTLETRKGVYLGVGHTKFLLRSDNVPDKNRKIYNKVGNIHKILKKVFKSKYKYHPWRVYCLYFFEYDSNTNKFLFSDSFLPIKLCNNYIFSLVFPMSIIYKYDKYWISMGYGDYTNLIASFTNEEIQSKLVHNAKNFDLDSYNIELLIEKNIQ